jgi:hypothetical protein
MLSGLPLPSEFGDCSSRLLNKIRLAKLPRAGEMG